MASCPPNKKDCKEFAKSLLCNHVQCRKSTYKHFFFVYPPKATVAEDKKVNPINKGSKKKLRQQKPKVEAKIIMTTAVLLFYGKSFSIVALSNKKKNLIQRKPELKAWITKY